MEKKDSDRRGFFSKITAAILGATLLGSMNIKQATAACDDYVRMGGTYVCAFQTTLSSTADDTLEVRNSSTNGNAIFGYAGYTSTSTATIESIGKSDTQ